MYKNFLIISALVVCIIIAVVFFRISSFDVVFDPQGLDQSTEGGSLSVIGTVSSIDLSGLAFDGPGLINVDALQGGEYTIAVPSMGIRLCEAFSSVSDISTIAVGDEVHVLGMVDEDGRIIPCTDEEHFLKVTGFVRDTIHGFEFAYQKGPDGYIELLDTESTSPDYVTGHMLFNKQEYDVFMESTDAREGPTSMHVRVYQNPQKLQAPVWALRYPQESNIERVFGEPEEVMVSGANAVYFVADGLYPIATYILAHGEYMFVLTGSYLDVESKMYEDFQSLVRSFTLIPTPSSAS